MTTQAPVRGPSRTLVVGPDRAPARAMLRATGLTDDDFRKPLIGVANTWIEVMPCNFHLRRLSKKVKEGVRAAGGVPIEFNTIAVSDGVAMGTEGMKASLISREVIADSIELVVRGHLLDGVIAISACDKTIPGTVMALCRMDLPSVAFYGGSIMPGVYRGQDVTIQEVFEAVGAHSAGRITDADLYEIEKAACPGPGACGGQFTANTMATAIETLGISPMGSGSVPAMDPAKDEAAFEAGRLVMDVVERDLRPSRIVTRKSYRKRHRHHRRHRRLDEWRAALPGYRQGDGRAPRHRRLRRHQQTRPRCSPTSSPAGGTWRRICTPRAASHSSPTGCWRRACCTRTR